MSLYETGSLLQSEQIRNLGLGSYIKYGKYYLLSLDNAYGAIITLFIIFKSIHYTLLLVGGGMSEPLSPWPLSLPLLSLPSSREADAA